MKETILVNNEEFEVEVLRKVEVVISQELYNMLDEHIHIKFDEYKYADIFSPYIIKEALEETSDELIVEEYSISEEDIKDLKTIIALFEEHKVNLVSLNCSL